MKVTAREVLRRWALNYTYTAQLLMAMTANIGPRWKRVSANWTAQGSESVILDVENQMEYVVTIVPRRRPEDVTLQ